MALTQVQGGMIGSLPTGSVIQVVNTTTTTPATTASTSYVNFSPLNTTITPKFATSKILVIAQLMLYSGENTNYQVTLYRGGSNLGPSNGFAYGYSSAVVNLACPVTMSYLDSPATTSATTYSVYGKIANGTLYFNNGNCQLSMTLLEIAA